MKQETLDQVAALLKHPFAGLRKTDPQLAQAALTGHLGLRRSRKPPVDLHESLSAGLREKGIPLRRSGLDRLRGLLNILQRRWYLRRNYQVDQGNTPWCVDATRCHWQLSLPVYGKLTHPLGDLYNQCKQIDAWPDQDGTSAEYMLEVCKALDLVESSWWYRGPEDVEAVLRWLTEVGGLWFGANWPESAFRTRRLADGSTDGVIEATTAFAYGHETYIIGRANNYKRMGPHLEITNSWGQDNWGIRGRGWISEQDFFDRWMHPDHGWGDLVGVVEKATA